MKVIRCKLQLQTSKPISKRQKDYYYACPIRKISVGNTVLVQYSMCSKKNRKYKYTYLTVAKVEEIYEGKAKDLIKEYHPTSVAVCMLEEELQDYDDFWKRLNRSKCISRSIYHKYIERELLKENSASETIKKRNIDYEENNDIC